MLEWAVLMNGICILLLIAWMAILTKVVHTLAQIVNEMIQKNSGGKDEQ